MCLTGEVGAAFAPSSSVHRHHQPNEMHQIKINIRKPGQNQEHPVVLDRFISMVISVLLTMVSIGMLTITIVFGYFVLGVVFAALLIAIVVSLIFGALQNFRR
jgi:hypothetical protein